MENKRNLSLDLLRGVGIVLMIIGHMPIPGILKTLIFSFHMPLFFFLSGYLYKDKNLIDLIRKNIQKVLLPYIITSVIIFIFKILIDGNYSWWVSIFCANGSFPVLSFEGYFVGPLWFLVCYFVSILIFKALYNINSFIRIIVLLIAWGLGWLFKHYYNLLPFDIINSLPAVICMFVGFELRNDKFRNLCFHWISIASGVLLWGVSLFRGGVSMASYHYPLLFLNVITAFYGTFLVYKLIKIIQIEKCTRLKSFLQYTASNSIIILCAHSVDYLLGFTSLLNSVLQESLLLSNDLLINFILFLFKFSFPFVICFLFNWVKNIDRSIINK